MNPAAHSVFITGGTGYIGSRLIPLLQQHGHSVTALSRDGSRHKLPPGCEALIGDALDGNSYSSHLSRFDTFIQLVGVPHPGPSKARQFVEIDLKSAREAIRVAAQMHVAHFIYVSVAHPAPVMKAYIQVRSSCEDAIREAGLNATILRPWYVLGPGHRWPFVLRPFYSILETIPATRESALRLGLVTLDQMLAALVSATEHPVTGARIVDVPAIRAVSGHLKA